MLEFLIKYPETVIDTDFDEEDLDEILCKMCGKGLDNGEGQDSGYCDNC